MTDGEREEADAELQAAQGSVGEAIHQIVNILTVFKGEVDMAVEHARQKLEQFYSRFPDWKDTP